MWCDVTVCMSQEPWAGSAFLECVCPAGPFFMPDVLSSSSVEVQYCFLLNILHFNKFFKQISYSGVCIRLSLPRMNGG